MSLALLNLVRIEHHLVRIEHRLENKDKIKVSRWLPIRGDMPMKTCSNYFLSKLEIDPNCEKIQIAYQELRNYGAIAA